MKKIFTLIMGMLLICSSIWARTPEEAAAIASGFMSQKGTQANLAQRVQQAKRAGIASSTVSLEYTQFTKSNENAVYVFNYTDGGFVLVSAKDESREVLGYCDEGTFNKNDIPTNMQYWLQMYADELASIEKQPVLQAGQVALTRPQKMAAATTEYPSISPLLGNVVWGQGYPYNNKCPQVNGERCVTGCVATALSQIMYVHKYPTTGIGNYSYTTESGISASANFGATTYQWNQMLPNYGSNATTTNINSVATLMYHVGVASNMEYGVSASGANSLLALNGLCTYFGYDKGITSLLKDFMPEEDILKAVAADLQIGHPIYVSGRTKADEGHAFVCDGMQSNGYLHINWGWNGYCNGYFVLSALNPEQQGTGGSANNDAFTESVVLYADIQPDKGGEGKPLITVNSLKRTSADEVGRNGKVSFSMDYFDNKGTSTALGAVYYIIYDLNGNMVSYAGIGNFELPAGYHYNDPISVSQTIPSNLANGEYELEVAWVNDQGTIQPIYVKNNGRVRFPITVTSNGVAFEAGSSKEMTIMDAINEEQSGIWQIDLYSENFWSDASSTTDQLLRLYINSGSAYSLIGSYLLDGNYPNTVNTISADALYAVGNSNACKISYPTDLHVTIAVGENNTLTLQYYMVVNGEEISNTVLIDVPNWYVIIDDSYYYYQNYINYAPVAPLSASKALVLTQSLSHTDATPISYLVNGVVSNIRNTPEEILKYNTARFDISDDGTTNNQFYCYNTKWLNNSDYTTGKEITLTDDVIVYGQLQNYLGNTPEIKGYVYQHTSNQMYDYNIRIKKSAGSPMDISGGLWMWWWLTGANGQLVELQLDKEGWYSTTISTPANSINCLAVNQDVTGDLGWSGSQQTVDYNNITGDICLEIGGDTGYGQYAIYETTCENSVEPSGITYELNGGVTNDYGWLSKSDMWEGFKVDAGITTLASLDELKAAGDASFGIICNPLGTSQAQAILDNAKWDWLEAYIMEVQNADASATTLVEGTASAGWRYALAAFFLEMKRGSWPKSADFSQAGKDEAYIPAWEHAYDNPTEPTEEFVLNAPYKEGSTFAGWYTTADFSGEKVLTVDANTKGTLYAKWRVYVPTIAEVRAMEDGTETYVAGVVNHISDKNVYIQDATGGILVYTSATPDFQVGDQILAKGVKKLYGGAPELGNATVEEVNLAELYDPIVFEDLNGLVNDTELKYFALRVSVSGLKIASYDAYNNPTVSDLAGNTAVCYKMVLNPTEFPVGTKVKVTAVAGYYNSFQFMGDISGIEKTVAGKKEQYVYPVRHDKYYLENNWGITNTEGNYAANKPGNTGYVRGMAVKDGIMYFINRETASLTRVDMATGEMLDPIKITGEHLFEVEQDGEWVSGVTLPYNDIHFDQAGNCLIGGCTYGTQTFFIYEVNLKTGVATEVIRERLYDNPNFLDNDYRFDAFGVAGDVNGNGVIMAADANGSFDVYRWLIKGGKPQAGERLSMNDIGNSLFANVSGWGMAPQIFPRDEEGSFFYVDGFNTLPILFNEEGGLVDDFINCTYGTIVTNNPGEKIKMATGHNGVVEFKIAGEYFLIMAATNTAHSVPSSYALYKFADANRNFSGLEPLWYLPTQGMGSVTNAARVAVPSVQVNGNTATIALYTMDNGYATYTFTVDVEPSGITYELNGGVTNDYGWLNKNDMFQACMADCGVTGLPSLDEIKAESDPFFTICSKLTDVSSILNNEKWDWLEAYIMEVQNADASATTLVEGTASAGWRYALAAFFLEMKRGSWPKSADFSQAGKDEAYIPAWKHAYDNPAEVLNDWVLNAPYKACHAFDGWYASPEFVGEPVTIINAISASHLYAKWTEVIDYAEESVTACDSYEWNGETYTASGEYTTRLANMNGCDSIVTLHLTINQTQYAEETVVACDSYTWNGETYTVSGEYTYTTTASNGCDSIVTLHLTINETKYAEETVVACDSYTWNGETYTASGEYVYTTIASNGCDSIVTLHLTINQTQYAEESITACDSYTWNGETYTVSGEYTYTTTASNGCDSIVTLHLTINETKYAEETVVACDSYTWNGETYTASGEYVYTTIASNGCDSIVTLHLTINESEYVEETVTVCDSYEWNGLVYTESGDYTYNTTTDQGCERVEVLHLTILPEATIESEELALCPSELPYEWYGQTLTEAGSYTVIEQYAGMECDSVVHELTMNVYVQTLPVAMTLPIVRTGEAIDVTVPTAEIQANIAAETWYAPNAEVAWYILENSDWAALTAEPVKVGTKQVVLKYAVETDCGNVESDNIVVDIQPTSVENTPSQLPITNCQKILYEDHIYILRDGKMYTIMGAEVK